MQICFRCHQYHDDKADVCSWCKIDTLIDAEIPEEYKEECDEHLEEQFNCCQADS